MQVYRQKKIECVFKVRECNRTAHELAKLGHLCIRGEEREKNECVFKGRECNRAAHELAILGRMCIQGEEQVSSSIPEDVRVIVANDLLAE